MLVEFDVFFLSIAWWGTPTSFGSNLISFSYFPNKFWPSSLAVLTSARSSPSILSEWESMVGEWVLSLLKSKKSLST